jgi:methanogenic corrinoid protein MtbC1
MMHSPNQQLVSLLRPHLHALAQRIADRLIAQSPADHRWLVEAALAEQWVDVPLLLLYLTEAVALDDPSLLADYLAWDNTRLTAHGLPQGYLQVLLEQTDAALRQVLPSESQPLLAAYLCLGQEIREGAHGTQSLIRSEAPLGPLAEQYLQALLQGERHRASRLVLDAARSGVNIKAIYLHVFQVAQREVGRLFQIKRASIAEEHYCTAATQLIMGQLSSYVFGTERLGRSMVAAAVVGESHDIGIRMVADFFEMEGWDTFYLGANTPVAAIVEAILERKASLLALSVTTSIHVGLAAKAIDAVRAASPGVRILVGGYPFLVSPELWKRVGADGSASDAEDAVRAASELVTGVAP